MEKKYLSLLTILASFLCMSSINPSSAVAEHPPIVPGTAVAITSVQIDTVSKMITIQGLDLDHVDSDELSVSLGNQGELSIHSVSADGNLIVEFPAEGLPDGDYLLTVSSRKEKRNKRWKRKAGKSHNKTLAFYHLTIGAVGPKGETGPPGPQGLQGETGLQGPQGETGFTGAQGETGSQGATGPIGPRGEQGVTGTQGPRGIPGPQGSPDPAVAEMLSWTMDELCRLYLQTGRNPLPDFCDATPATCVEANGLLWCYNYDTCGLACDDVCSTLGLNVIADNNVWFEAQNTTDECVAISEAFGLGSTVDYYAFGCIEDAVGPHDVPGVINGPLSCSTYSGCPQLHRTDMDQLGAACESDFSRKSICPCE